tara:strand:- start:17637 stop:17873 length:237 start_codon:yes stop_codon:yes gene_type:complete
MKTIKLKINDAAYDKFLNVLGQFGKEEIEIINGNEYQKDWWTEMTAQEQEEIKTGLDQANKGDVISNEKIMKPFNKWH